MNVFKTNVAVFLVLATVFSCQRQVEDYAMQEVDPEKYNPDWTTSSHGQSNRDYSIVFPQEIANKIEIRITPEQWKSIRANMTTLFGNDFGEGGGGPGGGGPGGGGPGGDGPGGGGPGGPGGPGFPTEEPDYVDVSLTFNGKLWKNVGFRLKGNSTLAHSWREGNYKFPFKLNFDKFEDTYPVITNQRFYGFKKLSFSPGLRDTSLMHEKITPEIFRMAGIPAAKTAFYRVYIDLGQGLKYCGVYTAVEYPDENMIAAQFGEEAGNIYKPESRFISFKETEFEKKNNEATGDYSDVEEFVTALNSSLRTTEPEKWRATLESTFNMDHFLKYLAVNNAIVNWDSYGSMAHNFYLYNHSGSRLTWIPWDHNEALTGNPGIIGDTSGNGGGGPGGGGPGGRKPLSLTMNEVTESWPLIYYVANDPVYMEKYKANLKWFNDEVFNASTIHTLIDNYYQIISSYVIGENGEQKGYSHLPNQEAFMKGYTDLKAHISTRKALISTYLP